MYDQLSCGWESIIKEPPYPNRCMEKIRMLHSKATIPTKYYCWYSGCIISMRLIILSIVLSACPVQCSTCAISGETTSDDTLICSLCKEGYEENNDVCASECIYISTCYVCFLPLLSILGTNIWHNTILKQCIHYRMSIKL